MKKIIFLIPFFATLFTSCATDDAGPVETGDTHVYFSTGSIPQVLSRSEPDAFDEQIRSVDILVFEEDKFVYNVRSLDLAYADGKYSFSARLESSNKSLQLLFVANHSGPITPDLPSEGESVAAYVSSLSRTTAWPLDGLPMTGTLTLPTGIRAKNSNRFDIKLLRSLASVQTTVEQQVRAKFELVSIQAYRANNSFTIFPADPSAFSVTTPNVPSGSALTANSPAVTSNDGHSTGGLYITEYDHTKAGAQAADRMCVVVGGRYNGGPVSYYRMDFRDSAGNLGDVLRNKRYNFNITDVSGDGWGDPDEAADNESSAIDVDIIQWDRDDKDIFIDGTNYLSLSDRTIYIHYFEHAVGGIDIETNFADLSIEWPGDNTVSAGPGEVLSGTDFEVRIDADKKAIVARAVQENTAGTKKAYFTLKAGRISTTIAIEQNTEAQLGYINVFNFGGVGTYATIGDDIFGNDLGQIFISWNGMRELMLNTDNFGSAGTVHFSGFRIGGILSTMPITSEVLELFHVIYIPAASNSNNIIIQEEADIIIDWAKKPRRALLIQNDYDCNQVLLQRLGVGFESRNANYNETYMLHDNAPRSVTHGPFGVVEKIIPLPGPGPKGFISRSDHPEVAPIVVLSDDPNQMIMGVDNDRKIIYCGDYKMYYKTDNVTGGSLTGGGLIENNNDVIMANALAWIVRTVLGDVQYDEAYQW